MRSIAAGRSLYGGDTDPRHCLAVILSGLSAIASPKAEAKNLVVL